MKEDVRKMDEEKLEEGWTPEEEREIITQRFLEDREQLLQAGKKLDLEWFEDRDHLNYREEEKARELLLDGMTGYEQLGRALTIIEEADSSKKFLGCHYTVWTTDGGKVNIKNALDSEKRDNTKEKVIELVKKDQQKYAFLRGIILGGSRSRDRLGAEWSQARVAGERFHDSEKMFNPTHLKSFPEKVPGISMLSTNSGTRYYVDLEYSPLIWQALDQIQKEWDSPVTTPEAEVPGDISQRIPKFKEVLDSVELTSEDVEEFEEILEENDALDYWADYVAPKVKFRDGAKKAVLCMLASPEDRHGNKGRTNAIIYGPPGTGKTAFKKFLTDKFGAYSIDGSRVSKADLTYNKSTGEDGLLVRAHKGLAVIEEADKMDSDAMGASLTALGESGQIEIRDKRFPAEVRGVMLGNYRSKEEIVEKHGEALFNRFEFVLDFDRLDEDELDETLDWHYEFYRKPKPKEDTSRLKKYLKWVRDFDPDIPEEELQKINEFKKERLDKIENVREGISVMSVAYTIARLNHGDVTLGDFREAFELLGM